LTLGVFHFLLEWRRVLSVFTPFSFLSQIEQTTASVYRTFPYNIGGTSLDYKNMSAVTCPVENDEDYDILLIHHDYLPIFVNFHPTTT
jgi:hypothetical protein